MIAQEERLVGEEYNNANDTFRIKFTELHKVQITQKGETITCRYNVNMPNSKNYELELKDENNKTIHLFEYSSLNDLSKKIRDFVDK